MAQTFDLQSQTGVGTVLVAELWPETCERTKLMAGLELGAICLPKAGETACGDAWAASSHAGRTRIMIADGLGHGILAADAAATATRVFQEHADQTSAEIIQRAHGALRSTRGAAVAIADVDPQHGVVEFVGVGNISGTIVADDGTRNLVSHNGTVGHEMRRVQSFTYPWPPGASLVMHSDGLATHWRLDRYPGLRRHSPVAVAGVLYRDFERGRDDVTVVVAREEDGV
jgi:serine phosphatase RsbU (regulator of sigma subunit)